MIYESLKIAGFTNNERVQDIQTNILLFIAFTQLSSGLTVLFSNVILNE